MNIIKGFDDLRWKDQDKIRHLIQENSTLASNQTTLKEKFGATVQSKRKCKGIELSSELIKAKQAKTDDEIAENFNEQEQTRLRKKQSKLLWVLKDNLRMEILGGVLKE
ncbi:unnamed protein product [Rotaria sordida]|uniref:Uncharacterized protein n=1 Tax=Rotaria sordida TaxID=392033 RepID=A0A815GQ09_9BILA|nr:unnamed protein product [Rotaria sordida]CAF1341466.1 unnamed protein product [Rotaria sordida]